MCAEGGGSVFDRPLAGAGVAMENWRILPFRLLLTARHLVGKLESMDISGIIPVEPGKRSGPPCIRGMRITDRCDSRVAVGQESKAHSITAIAAQESGNTVRG